jgi:single-strand DNA-binding protein
MEMAWGETKMTMAGRVCSEIGTLKTTNGDTMAHFSVVANERKYEAETNTWVTVNKLFLKVRCFRRLAENAAATLAKGDPVLVTGPIHTRKYDHNGERRQELEMDAYGIGPDLSLCEARVERGASAEVVAA